MLTKGHCSPDLDPEADGVADNGSDSEESDVGVGTEHYVSTGYVPWSLSSTRGSLL